MKNQNRVFVLASFFVVLLLSLFNACTVPVYYNLTDMKAWGPVVLVGFVITLVIMVWLHRLWLAVIGNVKNWKKLTWLDITGMVTILLLVKHFVP